MTLSLHHVVRPGTPGPGKPPGLILLHGVGSNERDMVPVANAIDPRFTVVTARSPLILGPGAYAWFNVRFSQLGPIIEAKEASDGWELLAKFIREVVNEYGLDESRVYLGGFSQGGIMSLAALLTSPQLVAGVVCMSGRLLPEVLPHAAPPDRLAAKPVLLLHGTADARLGVDYARKARASLQELGLDLTYHELPMGHEITRESLTLASSWLSARLDAVPTSPGSIKANK